MDTSVDDPSKRAAPAGESDERGSKKQKPDDESEYMEVSHVERMMQEDFVERQRCLGHVRRHVRGCAASRHRHEFLR